MEMMPEQEQTQEGVPSYTSGQEGQEEMDPQMKKKVETYETVLINLMHSEETKGGVIEALAQGDFDTEENAPDKNAPGPAEGSSGMPRNQNQTGDPLVSVPEVAVNLNDTAVAMMTDSGAVPDFGVQLAASALLIDDLIQLGQAAKLWPDVQKNEVEAIYEDTLQIVIERGLADGSIDPIQLQLDVEPLMNDDQSRAGQALAKNGNLSAEPSQASMTEQYAQGKVRNAASAGAQAKGKEKQTAMQGAVDQKVAQGGQPQ